MFKNSKTIILGLLIASSLYFQACKKASDLKPSTEMSEGLSSSQGIDIQTPHGIIRYENARLDLSQELYEKILDKANDEEIENFLEKTNFISLKKYYQNNPDLSPALQEIFNNTKISLLITSQRLIQIGDYIYKINKSDEKVFALHKNNSFFALVGVLHQQVIVFQLVSCWCRYAKTPTTAETAEKACVLILPALHISSSTKLNVYLHFGSA